jgi:thiamine-monophosphate kinase
MRSAPRLPGEFALIDRYFAPLSIGFPGAYGLLDDVAVINPSPGFELVLKTDAIVAGIDFPAGTAADLIARKALRVNLSDLAGKGAIPRAYMLNLMLPDSIDESWIAAFTAGLAQDQAEYGLHLIGGNMSATPRPVTIAVTAIGETPTGRTVRRGSARAGDLIFVTGTIGDAALGLAALTSALGGIKREQADFLVDRYTLPRPRVALGPKLIGIATASIDISDGLVADLRHVCEASKLNAVVEAPLVPLSEAAATALKADPEVFNAALTGGDDYEVLFTAPAKDIDAIAELSRSTAVPITRIGRMNARLDGHSRVKVLGEDGSPLVFESEGWSHF